MPASVALAVGPAAVSTRSSSRCGTFLFCALCLANHGQPAARQGKAERREFLLGFRAGEYSNSPGQFLVSFDSPRIYSSPLVTVAGQARRNQSAIVG